VEVETWKNIKISPVLWNQLIFSHFLMGEMIKFNFCNEWRWKGGKITLGVVDFSFGDRSGVFPTTFLQNQFQQNTSI
jgi:hypothetical protein